MSEMLYVPADCPNGHENMIPEVAYSVSRVKCGECGVGWIAPAGDSDE